MAHRTLNTHYLAPLEKSGRHLLYSESIYTYKHTRCSSCNSNFQLLHFLPWACNLLVLSCFLDLPFEFLYIITFFYSIN